MYSIDRYSYLWTTEKEDWVLADPLDYSIVNRKRHSLLLIEDDTLEKMLIERMLKEGNRVFDDINEAFEDV